MKYLLCLVLFFGVSVKASDKSEIREALDFNTDENAEFLTKSMTDSISVFYLIDRNLENNYLATVHSIANNGPYYESKMKKCSKVYDDDPLKVNEFCRPIVIELIYDYLNTAKDILKGRVFFTFYLRNLPKDKKK